jgi:hypothetical protein
VYPYQAYDVRAQRLTLAQTTTAKTVPSVPQAFSLEQNYPNPFNPVTQIAFEIPRAGEVTLDVFDLLGRRVAELVNAKLEMGPHRVVFDGSELASGIYFYRLEAGEFTQTKKLMLLK